MSKPNKQARQAREEKQARGEYEKVEKLNLKDSIIKIVLTLLEQGFSEEEIIKYTSEITSSLVRDVVEKLSKERTKERELKLIKEERLTTKESREVLIPNIFTRELSVLEVIIKFLREDKNLRYSEIAKLINRDPRSVWLTYKRAIKKRKEPLIIDESLRIPISIFSNKEFLGLSPLQVITFYLHDHQKLSFSRISSILKKNYTTIYTSYSRAVEKLRQTKQGEKQKEENGR